MAVPSLRPLRPTAPRRGSVAIEVALTLPILVLLLIAIAEWGITFPQQLTFENIARDSARAGSLVLRTADPEGTAVARANARLAEAGFDAADVTITTAIESTPTGDDALTVTLTKDYAAIFDLVPTPLQLIGNASFRLEDNT